MRTRKSGFTLIELMITVAVVAVLAAIAYPSYRRQVMRSHRTEAQVALNMAAQTLERCHTTAATYVGCAALSLPLNTPNRIYQVSAPAAIQPHQFTLVATPLGAQADDKECATFTITQAGHSATKEGGADNSPACWK